MAGAKRFKAVITLKYKASKFFQTGVVSNLTATLHGTSDTCPLLLTGDTHGEFTTTRPFHFTQDVANEKPTDPFIFLTILAHPRSKVLFKGNSHLWVWLAK